ncbi:hypothetical protein EYZ11_004221 [Aspergillus tanneri]|uniref:F-box domain-containing protein n=1 Tax=Aspergillus tanneri TaxID=1220188 RepID=A0A4S3JL72_9EURO|nr:hypothetical protein EYZ11_004221 [Aspergillus tanneri]
MACSQPVCPPRGQLDEVDPYNMNYAARGFSGNPAELPGNADVRNGAEQWWYHNPGHEYLAANPLYVPNLDALLLAAVHEEEDHFTPDIGTFDLSSRIQRSGIPFPALPADFLGSLPLELRLHVVDFLGLRDIADLRLASRAFEQLPVSIWYRLIRDEMPWLWEAWDEIECAHVPSIWTTVTANDVQLAVKKRQHYASVLSDEYPEDNIEDYLDFPLSMPMTTPRPLILPTARTNWYQVYTQIKRNWSKLKGLQNCQRIWADVEKVIARIMAHCSLAD